MDRPHGDGATARDGLQGTARPVAPRDRRAASPGARLLAGRLLAAAIAAAAFGTSPAPATAASAVPTGVRRPVALALGGERWLWVANARSGSVSLLDTERLELVDEFPVGESLSDLVRVPASDALLALDDRAQRLLVLSARPEAPALGVLYGVPVAPFPVRVITSPDGGRCIVTSLWSRRVEVFELLPDAPPRRLHSVELSFAPREPLLLGADRLLVADAFGGRLAHLDIERGALVRELELPVHNIRGLALTAGGRELAIAHQSLNPYATTSREDVFWGVLVSNRLLLVDPETLLGATGDPLRHTRGLDLGDLTSPAGDPGRIALTPSGELAVALGGTGRIGLGRPEWPRLDHVRLAGRPVALAASGDGRLYVAESLSDSIAVVDVARRLRLAEVALGPAPEPSEADRGEALFYDASLSLRGWMSCHSCHTDGHANGERADTLGDGGFGAPKRIPSLLGVADTGPWAWNGGVATLESQVSKSVHSTLNNSEADPAAVRALTAFLRTLQPPPPPPAEPAAVQRGREVFFGSGCDRCHTPPAYTSPGARDVGLADEVGNRRFNPPSLRGVRLRSSFLHDGRARRLEEVFSVHGHPGTPLPAPRVRDLVAYLSTL